MASSNPPRQEAEAVREKKTHVTSASPIAVAQEDVGEKFEKLRSGLQELQAAFDREREAVDADKLQNPGHGAHNFGQPILPLGGLQGTIEDTMYSTVYAWIEHFKRFEDYCGIPQLVLPRLFEECCKEATERYQLIDSILFPSGGKTDRTLLRDHMRNNHEELFLLTPSKEHDTALQVILHNVRSYLVSRPDRTYTKSDLDWVMNETGLEDVARKYRKILVHVKLQEPPVTFSNNNDGTVVSVEKKKSLLGRILPTGAASRAAEPVPTIKVEPFDPKRHSTPVDAMDIGDGDSCIVVFPAMEVGGVRITRSYTLGLKHRAELPPEGEDERGVCVCAKILCSLHSATTAVTAVVVVQSGEEHTCTQRGFSNNNIISLDYRMLHSE